MCTKLLRDQTKNWKFPKIPRSLEEEEKSSSYYCEWVRIRYYCDSGWFVWFFVKKLNRNNRVQGLIGTWSGNSAWQPIKIVLEKRGGVALAWIAPRPQRQWNIDWRKNAELWLFLTIFAWNFRILIWLLHPSFLLFCACLFFGGQAVWLRPDQKFEPLYTGFESPVRLWFRSVLCS